jgi:hypothetical protein
LEIGAEIARVYVRKKGTNPNVDMECELRAEPMLQQNVWLDDWLTNTQACVGTLLRKFAEPPQEILELGFPADTFLP